MKFYCDKCQAKYSIADEKVRGKVLKVRCKKCTHVITVKELRAPAAAKPVQQAAALPWYYALNGQTFGPYEEDALKRMFESGEVGDACYIWNETFTEWLPARQVQMFVPALEHGQKIRPRHKTIGVSGALEAINVEQIAPRANQDGEEAGVVPGQMADRIDSLRERLKQHSRTPDKPVISLTEKKPAGLPIKQDEEEDSTTQMSIAEISGLLDMPAVLPEEELQPLEIEEPLPELDENNLMGSLFSDEPSVPAFIGTSTEQDSAIDFSRLDKVESEVTSHDGMFTESASNFVPQDNEPEHFQASNSLLIQMDSIKKEGRSKRVVMIGALLLMFTVLAIVAVIAAGNSSRVGKIETEGRYDDSSAELNIKKYSSKERVGVFGLGIGEEVITAGDPAEADEPETDEPVNTQKKPVAVASNNKSNKKKNKGQTPGPNLRGLENLIGDNGSSAQDDALNASKSSKGSSSGSLKTNKDEGAGGIVVNNNTPSKSKSPFDNLPSVGSTDRKTSFKAKGVNTGQDASNSGPKLGQAGTLSSDEARKGFKKVSRSVSTCHQRQVSRGLPIDAPKVHITVEIKGDGSVSSIKLEPSSLRSSEFSSCLESHRKGGRWKFAEFGGSPLKIKHTYVLQ